MAAQYPLEVHLPLPSGRYLVIKVPAEYAEADKKFVNDMCFSAYNKMVSSGNRKGAQHEYSATSNEG